MQYGDYEEEDYYRLNFKTPLPSWMDFWPTDEHPDNMYKFASVWIELSQDEFMTERDTYSLLEWLGDVGGLFDMLRLMGSWLVVPFATFRLSSQLLSKIFRYISSLAKAKSEGLYESSAELQDARKEGPFHPEFVKLSLEESIGWDFSQPKLIKRKGFCQSICNKRYNAMMKKADKQITEELDLVKFLHR